MSQLSELVGYRLNMDVLVCGHKWSKYPLMLGNPLAVLKCQLRDFSLFVSNVPLDSSTLGVAGHHSRSCWDADSHVVSVGDHVQSFVS